MLMTRINPNQLHCSGILSFIFCHELFIIIELKVKHFNLVCQQLRLRFHLKSMSFLPQIVADIKGDCVIGKVYSDLCMNTHIHTHTNTHKVNPALGISL